MRRARASVASWNWRGCGAAVPLRVVGVVRSSTPLTGCHSGRFCFSSVLLASNIERNRGSCAEPLGPRVRSQASRSCCMERPGRGSGAEAGTYIQKSSAACGPGSTGIRGRGRTITSGARVWSTPSSRRVGSVGCRFPSSRPWLCSSRSPACQCSGKGSAWKSSVQGVPSSARWYADRRMFLYMSVLPAMSVRGRVRLPANSAARRGGWCASVDRSRAG